MNRKVTLLLCSGVLLCFCSCDVTSEPAQSEERQSISRQEINELIDSLANRNERPQWVGVQSRIARASGCPLFSENYDWKEDARIRDVAEELSKADKEDLWWCMMEHVDDKRYAISYVFNQYAKIASIGHLCSDSVFEELQGFYWYYSPGWESSKAYRPLRVLQSDEELKDWYEKHKTVPLYQQQTELGETALKKIQDLDPTIQKKHGISEEEKNAYITHINKQLHKLRDTKKPILGNLGLLNRAEEFYDAKVAQEIREKYREQQNKKTITK